MYGLCYFQGIFCLAVLFCIDVLVFGPCLLFFLYGPNRMGQRAVEEVWLFYRTQWLKNSIFLPHSFLIEQNISKFVDRNRSLDLI